MSKSSQFKQTITKALLSNKKRAVSYWYQMENLPYKHKLYNNLYFLKKTERMGAVSIFSIDH